MDNSRFRGGKRTVHQFPVEDLIDELKDVFLAHQKWASRQKKEKKEPFNGYREYPINTDEADHSKPIKGHDGGVSAEALRKIQSEERERAEKLKAEAVPQAVELESRVVAVGASIAKVGVVRTDSEVVKHLPALQAVSELIDGYADTDKSTSVAYVTKPVEGKTQADINTLYEAERRQWASEDNPNKRRVKFMPAVVGTVTRYGSTMPSQESLGIYLRIDGRAVFDNVFRHQDRFAELAFCRQLEPDELWEKFDQWVLVNQKN